MSINMDILTPTPNFDKGSILALTTATMITTRLIGHRDRFSLKVQACAVGIMRSASLQVGLGILK
jgi:hypothetical protein